MSTVKASRSTKPRARHGAWAWVGVGVAVVTGTAYLDFFIGPVRTQQMITAAYADLNTVWVWLLMITLAVTGAAAIAVAPSVSTSVAAWWLSRSGRLALLVATGICVPLVAFGPNLLISISS